MSEIETSETVLSEEYPSLQFHEHYRKSGNSNVSIRANWSCGRMKTLSPTQVTAVSRAMTRK